MNLQDMSFAALAVGLFCIGIFLLVKTGIFKSWLILKTLPGLLSARMFYMAFPLGLGFAGLSILPAFPNYDPNQMPFTLFLFIAVCGGPLIGFWFMGHPPKWLAPKWLQWLEREYGYCVDILLEEAQKMNRWAWEAQVRTQEGMQAWIDEVVARRRKEVDLAWIEEKLYRLDQKFIQGKIRTIKAGMAIDGYIPVHRQQDAVLTQTDLAITKEQAQRRAMHRKNQISHQ